MQIGLGQSDIFERSHFTMTKQIDWKTTEMGKLLESDGASSTFPNVGDILTGKVIAASKKEVLIDFNGVLTGIVRGKELYNESEEFSNLKIGDDVEATVMDLENEQGLLELSFRFAGHQKAWLTLQGYKEENKTVAARINDANKGGLLVTVANVHGFLPVSQLSPEFYPRVQGGDKNKILEKLKTYVGQDFQVKILDADEESEKLIVSEKNAWEEEQKDVLNKYNVGDLIEGTITAVTDFGVFVEFGENLEGLIHISELAWQRIDDPRELFDVNQKIKAEIIKIDGSKIFLSSKKLKDDPWKDIEKKYKIGDFVSGTVVKTTPFGLFVELDKDIHGLAHISELSEKTISNIEDFCKPGEVLKFRIVSLEPAEHRLGLSLKPEEEKKTVAEDKQESNKATKQKAETKESKEEVEVIEEKTE
ncbi:MAG: RNA binding S1 domain protein [Parcubacteria group bacterium GW2011_GWC2_39_14]|nr:MAG: RNA binding S1 domain protein [Parcubacteria group bacterium GW2011_GWC2_39_14]KKR54127.1 MAG: RNA binding S1 domain protein [Parcubacteria group bacterium GW2011_GWA2_40_23]